MDFLPHIEMTLKPKKSVDAAIIWLHGLGASGDDFAALVPELSLDPATNIRFIFPHAPAIPVTINGGYVMPAWYDIEALTEERRINKGHFDSAVAATQNFIHRELERGIESHRILVAGFSQGGAVAYQAALGFEQPLGGLLALSTYMIKDPQFKPHSANRQLPIHVYHGTLDDMVTPEMCQNAIDQLASWDLKPAVKRYNMGHEVCYEEIADISSFIRECIVRD